MPKLMSQRTLDMNSWTIHATNYGPFVVPTAGGCGGFWGGPGYNYIYGAGMWAGAILPSRTKGVANGYNFGQSEFCPVNPYTESYQAWLSDPLARVFLSTDPVDLAEWPALDSSGRPLVRSLQDSYCKYTDANPLYNFAGSERLNLVFEQTSCAWNYADNNDVVFFLFRAKNKNIYPLDSCYLGPAIDCDIGNEAGSSANDRTGFDCQRNLAFQFQSTPEPGWPKTGAVGFRFLEGPVNNNGYDVNIVDDQYPHTIPQGAMLGLTAFTIFTINIDPKTDEERFLALAGWDWLSGTLDAYDQFGTEQAGDKKFLMGSGPFLLWPDSSVSLSLAIIGADDTVKLKLVSDVAQQLYDNGFVQACPPTAPAITAVPGDGKVYLSWNNAAETTPDPYYPSIVSTPSWHTYFKGSWEHCFDKLLVDSFIVKTGTSTNDTIPRGEAQGSWTDTLYARYSQKAMYYPYDFQAYALYRAASREDLGIPGLRTQLGVLHTGSSGAKSLNWDLDDGIQIVRDFRTLAYSTPDTTYILPIYDTLGTDCGLAYGFVDSGVTNGVVYWYGLSAIDYQPNACFTRKCPVSLASNPSQPGSSAVPRYDIPGSQPAGIQIRVDLGDTAATDYWHNTKVVNPPAVSDDSFKLFWQEASKRTYEYYGKSYKFPVYTGIIFDSMSRVVDSVVLDPEIYINANNGVYIERFFGPSRDEVPFGGIVFQPYLDYHKSDCILDSIVVIEASGGVRTYPKDSLSMELRTNVFDATNSLWQWRGSDFEIRWIEDTLRVSGNLRNILRAQVWDLTNNVEVPMDTLTKSQMTTSGWAFNPADVTGLSFCDSTLSGGTSGAGFGMHICGLSLFFNWAGTTPRRIGSLWDQRPENGDVWRVYTSGPRPPHAGGRATFILSPPRPGYKIDDSPNLLLYQNIPNPFAATTAIIYRVEGTGYASVTLNVYNVLGQRVRSLAGGMIAPGFHQAVWDGRDGDGGRLPAGVYFCRLQINQLSRVRKMVLLR